MKNTAYRIIRTEDGTYTLHSTEYSQTMHSDSGAYDEALQKHVYPGKILELQEEDAYVLDVGFGIGYNALASIVEFSKKKEGSSI
jgi:hypothetical protein